jgi:hypothetical protein
VIPNHGQALATRSCARRNVETLPFAPGKWGHGFLSRESAEIETLNQLQALVFSIGPRRLVGASTWYGGSTAALASFVPTGCVGYLEGVR